MSARVFWGRVLGQAWIVAMALVALDAHAEIDNRDLLDNVLIRYSEAASGWATTIENAASWLFWTLALISMVWTFGMLALRKADIGEFFAEFFRYIMFTGFFWWLLDHGPTFAVSIMDSMRKLGGDATGLGTGLSPSNIVDVGFGIFGQVIDGSSAWSPVNSAIGIIVGAVILVVLAIVAVNMLILLISGWVLAYAGVFFLGFGGSRWTSEMAIHYYKTVLNIAAQLFAMVLLVGIAKTFLDDYYSQMATAAVSIKDLGVMLIVSVILLMLVNKVPPLVGGLAGGHVHAMGSGISGGAALGAAGAAVATAGGVIASAGTTIALQSAGGASAVMAALSQARENTAQGNDVMARAGTSVAGALGWSGGSSSGSDTGRSLGEQMGMQGQGVAPAAATGGASAAASAAQGARSGGSSAGIGSIGGDQGAGQVATSTARAAGGASGGRTADLQSPVQGDGQRGVGTQTSGGSPVAATDKRASDAGGGAGIAGGGSSASRGSAGPGSAIRTEAPGAGALAAGAILGVAGTGARIAADSVANLAMGGSDVVSAKIAELRDAARDRIGETFGGQVAHAIRARGAAAQEEAGENVIEALRVATQEETALDREAEIAAFRDRPS